MWGADMRDVWQSRWLKYVMLVAFYAIDQVKDLTHDVFVWQVKNSISPGSGAGLPNLMGPQMRATVLELFDFPFWIPMLILFVPTVYLSHRDWQRWKRVPAGYCPKCRYDLTGNTSGICPECGEQI
jgi:hypothetical protein